MQLATLPKIDRHQLAADIKHFARRLGFDLVGICGASPSAYRDYYRQWLDDGRGGTMKYLARRFDERTDVAAYVSGARSVVCVALNYHVPLQPFEPSDQEHRGKVARYALGDDYHELIKSRLYKLADFVRSKDPDAQTRC